ncbi:hypothetical protein Syun_029645 [Stephania yunnanensis]|uniref:Uncharacterized protein n=1 Tax=Stephania yunnanensis TaxID=152371 RepID=A0AAP0E605_9MAGN
MKCCQDCGDLKMVCFDVMNVVAALNSNVMEHEDLNPLIYDIKSLLKDWDPDNYCFVPR